MTWIRRALAVGAGFGLAAAAIDLWLAFFGVMALRTGRSPVTLAGNLLLSIALGAVLSLLCAIALRALRRATPILHLVCLCASWFLVERWVWIDAPLFVLGALVRPLGAGMLVLSVLALERFARRFALLPWVRWSRRDRGTRRPHPLSRGY